MHNTQFLVLVKVNGVRCPCDTRLHVHEFYSAVLEPCAQAHEPGNVGCRHGVQTGLVPVKEFGVGLACVDTAALICDHALIIVAGHHVSNNRMDGHVIGHFVSVVANGDVCGDVSIFCVGEKID